MPPGVTQLDEAEAHRETSNTQMFRLLDSINVLALLYVWAAGDSCYAQSMHWYYINGLWACVSIAYLTWFDRCQLQRQYTTTKGVVGCYVIELGYLCLSVYAMAVLSGQEYPDECKTEQGIRGQEVFVDLVLIDMMRCLKVMLVAAFAVFCGPFALVCYLIYRPKPAPTPESVNDKLCKVTLTQLEELRRQNYRHTGSSVVAGEEVLSEEVCCICMDEFSSTKHVVILPCRAHYFHPACIKEWVKKKQACPQCR